MSQGDSFGEQPYADEPYAQPGGYAQSGESAQPAGSSGSKVNVPTILASAGIAAVISALIVTIGVVGLATSDKFGTDTAAAQPTVVNLGNAQGTQTPNGVTTPQNTGDQAAGTPVAGAPTENVPESNGDAGTGTGTQGTQGTQGTGTDNGTAPQTGDAGQGATTPAQSATPAPLTAGQLNTKVKTIMNTGASNATRADELQGGQQALGSVNAVAQMLKVSGAGFSYKVVGPVTQNGTTLNARLQMSLVGNGSRYLDLSWVWTDNKWKLSNTSVCTIAEYAMLKCTV
ncbi:hypothetical protein L5G28_06265 [Gordonia sp. HY285]|uniref:hypothetical protein n=1 Tax=Gordonia liuliyuniae TaxID=2911517 RepID=UPI001F41F9DA|nr:hypothetical protein [Gordonia liuliyuniae]MCF8609767.1 hypothetical protein [Gordonia liuliyuniae]